MSAAALVTAAELAYPEAAGLGEPGARLLGRIEQGRREIDWRDQDRETDLRGATQACEVRQDKRAAQRGAKGAVRRAVDADIAALEDPLEDAAHRTPS
jgi:hypothetical protein